MTKIKMIKTINNENQESTLLKNTLINLYKNINAISPYQKTNQEENAKLELKKCETVEETNSEKTTYYIHNQWVDINQKEIIKVPKSPLNLYSSKNIVEIPKQAINLMESKGSELININKLIITSNQLIRIEGKTDRYPIKIYQYSVKYDKTNKQYIQTYNIHIENINGTPGTTETIESQITLYEENYKIKEMCQAKIQINLTYESQSGTGD